MKQKENREEAEQNSMRTDEYETEQRKGVGVRIWLCGVAVRLVINTNTHTHSLKKQNQAKKYHRNYLKRSIF